MAADAVVKVKMVADRGSAKAAADDLKRDVQTSASVPSATPPTPASTPSPSASNSPAKAESAATVPVNPGAKQHLADLVAERKAKVEAASANANTAQEIGRAMADAFAKVAGDKLTKVLGGFMIGEGLSTAFALSRRVGDDNSRSEQAEATINGAITMGSTAAASGLGPVGIALGAVVGGLNSFLLKQKAIEDAIAERNMQYDIERNEAKATSREQAGQMIFDSGLGRMGWSSKAKAIRDRKAEITGDEAFAKSERDRYDSTIAAYRNLLTTKAMQSSEYNTPKWTDEESKIAEDAMRMSGEIKDMVNIARQALDENNGNRGQLSVLGQKFGTSQFWRTLEWAAMHSSESGFGNGGSKTGEIRARLTAANNQADSMDNPELAVYLEDARRQLYGSMIKPQNDSLSSKGMGYGAQIDVLKTNQQMLQCLQKIENLIRNPPKDGTHPVEAFRSAMGGLFN